MGLYARISVDKDGEQTATARQLQDCRARAEREGWEVADVFEDVDISAFDLKARRPDFDRMLDALRSGEIDGLVIWKIDRLTRQMRDLVRVMEACAASGAFLVSVTEPIDTREPYGQFVAELLVAQARMESANTSTRLRRKARELKEHGRPPTSGVRCFGYQLGFTAVVHEEAAIIREVRDRIFAGETLNSVCFDLERRGVVGSKGRGWRPPNLRRLLLSPTIAGIRVDGEKYFEGTWEPLISVEDHLRLRSLLVRPGRTTDRRARSYLLTGFLRCGRCGSRMRAQARAGQVGAYACSRKPGESQCGKMSVKAEPLHDLVRDMLVAAVDDAALREAMAARSDADDGLMDAIRADDVALEQLSRDHYVDRTISREMFFAAQGPLQERLEANRARLAKRSGRNVMGEYIGSGSKLQATWDAGSLEWQRSIVGAILQHVIVHPGQPGRRPFDPARVEPVWRF